MTHLRAVPVFAASAVALIVLPALLFMGAALFRDMGIANGASALAEQYVADRTNLLVITALGLLPLLLVALLLGVRRVVRKTWTGAGDYALGGALPVLAVTVFVHLQYWPSWLPNRRFLGFPHGLEFVIGPFVFAPIGVLLGFLVVWVARKRA